MWMGLASVLVNEAMAKSQTIQPYLTNGEFINGLAIYTLSFLNRYVF